MVTASGRLLERLEQRRSGRPRSSATAALDDRHPGAALDGQQGQLAAGDRATPRAAWRPGRRRSRPARLGPRGRAGGDPGGCRPRPAGTAGRLRHGRSAGSAAAHRSAAARSTRERRLADRCGPDEEARHEAPDRRPWSTAASAAGWPRVAQRGPASADSGLARRHDRGRATGRPLGPGLGRLGLLAGRRSPLRCSLGSVGGCPWARRWPWPPACGSRPRLGAFAGRGASCDSPSWRTSTPACGSTPALLCSAGLARLAAASPARRAARRRARSPGLRRRAVVGQSAASTAACPTVVGRLGRTGLVAAHCELGAKRSPRARAAPRSTARSDRPAAGARAGPRRRTAAGRRGGGSRAPRCRRLPRLHVRIAVDAAPAAATAVALARPSPTWYADRHVRPDRHRRRPVGRPSRPRRCSAMRYSGISGSSKSSSSMIGRASTRPMARVGRSANPRPNRMRWVAGARVGRARISSSAAAGSCRAGASRASAAGARCLGAVVGSESAPASARPRPRPRPRPPRRRRRRRTFAARQAGHRLGARSIGRRSARHRPRS